MEEKKCEYCEAGEYHDPQATYPCSTTKQEDWDKARGLVQQMQDMEQEDTWEERFDVEYPSQTGVSGGIYITMYATEKMKSFIASEITKARIKRDGEMIIMMHECIEKGWSFSRFIHTFCALYESKLNSDQQQKVSSLKD